MKITLVQSNLEWQQAEANREILAGMLAQSVTETDLIVSPGDVYQRLFGWHVARFLKRGPAKAYRLDASRLRPLILMPLSAAASPCWKTGNASTAWSLSARKAGLAHYDKRHLFRMLGEHKRYQRWGTERAVLSWRGWRILPLVCYDLRFPVWSRNTPDLAYDLLLYVANWPGARNYHWQTLLKARAIENLAYVAGVNRIGHGWQWHRLHRPQHAHRPGRRSPAGCRGKRRHLHHKHR